MLVYSVETGKDTAIVAMECELETIPKLFSGTMFNDLEWHLTQISRLRYYSMSNNSEAIQDRATVTVEYW